MVGWPLPTEQGPLIWLHTIMALCAKSQDQLSPLPFNSAATPRLLLEMQKEWKEQSSSFQTKPKAEGWLMHRIVIKSVPPGFQDVAIIAPIRQFLPIPTPFSEYSNFIIHHYFAATLVKSSYFEEALLWIRAKLMQKKMWEIVYGFVWI